MKEIGLLILIVYVAITLAQWFVLPYTIADTNKKLDEIIKLLKEK